MISGGGGWGAGGGGVYFYPHLSLQLLYFPNRSLPQFPYMSPASLTFLKQRSGAGRPPGGWKEKRNDRNMLVCDLRENRSCSTANSPLGGAVMAMWDR